MSFSINFYFVKSKIFLHAGNTIIKKKHVDAPIFVFNHSANCEIVVVLVAFSESPGITDAYCFLLGILGQGTAFNLALQMLGALRLIQTNNA